ncbi:hypothetical protein [Streptomyces sp. A012304]|uniref:hypothetical protein n=1 Tax=Streptomyces sp. A012304 TaxID=375446 RepID=UPI002231F78A|nr:hypothetical protein [Streptomyces sp. A012304]GKQ41839.1 hypothetical protein ALMP_83520 [Streptomyces sp. A012304]
MAGRVRGTAVAVLLAAALGACGTVPERHDQVRDAATAFEHALRERAYDRVCALLAPGTREELEQSSGSPCPDAVGEEPLPAGGAVRTTDVHGNQARAVLTTDTLFLSHFDAGWKVVAAGCEPRGERPYQCRIKGG